MIYIRVDANEKIGTGHIMRCLSIASRIQNLNYEVAFVVADNRSVKIVEEKGFQVICLDTQWDKLDSEVEIFCKLIEDNRVKQVLVDSYYVTEKYLSEIRKFAKTYYIDDLNEILYSVDTLINYNIYGSDLDYQKKYDSSNTTLMLGTLYVPLREEFSGLQDRIFKGIRKVLITSGGTDNYDMVGSILNRVQMDEVLRGKDYYCVLGRFNINIDSLYKRFGCYNNIHFLQNITNMDYYMKDCDVAVTAGGSTTYELCACGIPSVLYSIADNQLGIANAFSKKGVIPWAGDVRKDLGVCLNNVVEEINLLSDAVRWEKRSRDMQRLVDGHGASRIAKHIVENSVQ